ncbi:hypothetical protein ACFQRC_00745 [Enterovirga sp. GCM10030262]|uniref:hypothetical protein n=1 Tax=Enterovirga sp. GCM10030262 TaxID=3273391 RepID=UPI0036119D02
MRTTVFAIAILMSGAAFAQTADTELDVDADVGIQADGDLDVDADVDVQPDEDAYVTPSDVAATTDPTMVAAMDVTPTTSPVVQPSNADPEHDARGIAVISAPALVPPGWNGMVVTAVGGPLVDPTTGESTEGADATYPACSASVTDNCLQAYERGRSD